MTDLFGDTITSPTIAESSIRHLINASHGFAEFWSTWPSGPRKVAKQQCLNKWAKYGCCNNATMIKAHVEWMKTQDDWMRGFVCQPLTYLNQQRWLDWTPEPPKEDAYARTLRELEERNKGAKPMPESMRRVRVTTNIAQPQKE
jgi:hypothetical protein